MRRIGYWGEWQRESYDHWVRDEKEWSRIAAYIENNPVKAGIVAKTEDYLWSSANNKWRMRLSGLGDDTSVGAAHTSTYATEDRATQASASTSLPRNRSAQP